VFAGWCGISARRMSRAGAYWGVIGLLLFEIGYKLSRDFSERRAMCVVQQLRLYILRQFTTRRPPA